jgi:hypothetical protein
MLWLLVIFAIWGCIPELGQGCVQPKYDMTNTSSTYLSIVAGAAIGVAISWWVYKQQNKISVKQEHSIQHIKDLEERHGRVMTSLEKFAKHHDELLNRTLLLNESILKLDQIIQSLVSSKNEG